MDESQKIPIFIALTSVVVLVLIAGIIIFIFQYRKRKLMHLHETNTLNEQHIQELLSTQVEMQQQTMQFIGREIHDSVGQKLTLASLYAQQLNYKNDFPEAKSQLDNITNILNESLSELRSLSKNLTDETQHHQPLIKLLQTECERINSSGICHASLEGLIKNTIFQQVQKNVILRIVQEFMQNSLKHSGCKKIYITVSEFNNVFQLKISDDGKGFDISLADSAKNGIGLINMKRRAETIGATSSLVSEIGKGTYFILDLPVKN